MIPGVAVQCVSGGNLGSGRVCLWFLIVFFVLL